MIRLNNGSSNELLQSLKFISRSASNIAGRRINPASPAQFPNPKPRSAVHETRRDSPVQPPRQISVPAGAPEERSSSFTPSALQAFRKHRVLYVDRSLVILNKPPGLVAQGTMSIDPVKRAETIQGALDDLQNALGQSEPLRTVHRLDKTTTGALVLARNPKVIRTIHQQFDQGSAQKIYLAVVHDQMLRKTLGRTPGAYFPELIDHELRHGTIDAPITVGCDGNVSLDTQPCVDEKLNGSAKKAITSWQWLSHSAEPDYISLMRLHLRTGLKHQLRVHLSSILDTPILGDHVYGIENNEEQGIKGLPPKRLMLHASQISLVRYKKEGPKKQFKLTVVAPLPADFVKLCKQLDLPLEKVYVEGGVLIDGEPCTAEQLWDVASGHWIHGHLS